MSRPTVSARALLLADALADELREDATFVHDMVYQGKLIDAIGRLKVLEVHFDMLQQVVSIARETLPAQEE